MKRGLLFPLKLMFCFFLNSITNQLSKVDLKFTSFVFIYSIDSFVEKIYNV